MYKHILIPTDGSETAEKGVQAGLEFAKWAGARVTVFTARPEYRMPGTSEVAAGRVMPIAEYERRSMEEARKILDFIASPGRKGLSGLLYGSETHEILTHSTVPTLVYR